MVESVGDAHLVRVQTVARVDVDGMRGFWDGCGTEPLVLLLFTLYSSSMNKSNLVFKIQTLAQEGS